MQFTGAVSQGTAPEPTRWPRSASFLNDGTESIEVHGRWMSTPGSHAGYISRTLHHLRNAGVEGQWVPPNRCASLTNR
jgi:hypothetical protein